MYSQYLDHANCYLQIYLINEEQQYTLTDDGWILDDIKHLVSDDENLKSIGRILRRLSIDKNQNEISVKTGLANLTSTKENFMLAINTINEFCCKNIKI